MPRKRIKSTYRICVFTGAGIGAPLKLPTTNQFANTIAKIKPQLLVFIKSFLGSKSDDIEKVLYLLEDFVRIDDLTSHIISSSSEQHFVVVKDNVDQYKKWAKEAILKIKSDIYDLLEDYDYDDAFKLYSSIVKEIKHLFKNSSISFFTTNYDLTFENGFAEQERSLLDLGIKEIQYGFTGKNKATFDPSQKFNWSNDVIEYKKLHGSLDWITNRKRECIRTGENVKPRNPSEMPVLYPGFKGIPSTQPFIELHDQLSDRLDDANYLIIIGFAFRDKYLNKVFDAAMRRNPMLQVLCYNPANLNSLPEDSDLKDFVHKYPKRFQHIKQKVQVLDNTLNLFVYA